ncbi:cytochrome-c peroxidase [Taibaiella koreensis]|uniref:cytochrome-c peroxidase n=1 Tax=Taibaiella koreensis TaxID=1268548 RepID=UPI00196914D7|nr:cytochrome c peroxidase [Taibaiella koreensis]
MKIRSSIVRSLLVLTAGGMLAFYSCKKDNVEEQEPVAVDPSLANIEFKVPESWPLPVYNFSNNPLTKEGFKLGRKLFFDPILSRDNSISCGTCHQPFAAFSQLDHAVSHGVDDRVGTRNSPALFNLNWHSSFFWDGGVNHIEMQPFAPITNPLEMDETLANVIAKLQARDEYKQLFKDAFGTDEITTQKMTRALAQFMGMMVSSNAPYDKYMRHEGTLSADEMAGLTVFRSKCAACHTEPLFSDFSLRNNGLALQNNEKGIIDSGRGIITPLDPSSFYKFKVPSLRNLKYTAPYMHDGRLATIDAVLDHYTGDVQHTPNLDPLLENGISLSAQERQQLKAFLNTLNDETFVKDIRFQEPK